MSDDRKKLQDLVDEFVDLDLIEDRTEYTTEDFQSAYPHLSAQECEDLYYLVQTHVDPDHVSPYEFFGKATDAQARIFTDGCVEALHGDLDGWDNEHDRIVIERFLADMARYTKTYEEMEKTYPREEKK